MLFYKHLSNWLIEQVSHSSFVKISSQHLQSQTLATARARVLTFWEKFTSPHQSPNLPCSEGIGSPAAAIPLWKLCRGKSSEEVNWSVQPELLPNPPWHFYRGIADHKWFRVVVFERSSGCAHQFTFAEILPIHNFQKWDCRFMWVYSFGIEEVWWMPHACYVYCVTCHA